jgi:putative two-component system response regulator
MPSSEISRQAIPAPGAASVLVVDDEQAVRQLMSTWLNRDGYTVVTAETAEHAVDLLEREPLAVALCDIRLPGHDGLWLADRIRRAYPETAVVMATGVLDIAPAVESLRQGVVDYLTKPFERGRLQDAVRRGVEWHTAAHQLRQSRESVDREIETRQARLVEAITALRIDSDERVDAMLALLTIENREGYAHAYRVAALTVRLARALDLSDEDVAIVGRSALLHDLGKLALPERLLRKSASLSTEDQRLLRMHPSLGSAILEKVPYLSTAAAIVRDVHERMDGLGYPAGRRGPEIPVAARIVSVAVAYDSMTRPAATPDGMSPAEAVAEIDRSSATQFDNRVVEALRGVIAGSQLAGLPTRHLHPES